MSQKLTAEQESVLRFLYENQNARPSDQEIAARIGMPLAKTKDALRSLQEMGLVGGPKSLLDRIVSAMRELDPDFNMIRPGSAESIVLLSSFFEPADEDSLAAELGFDLEFVKTVGSRLRSSGIWRGDNLSERAKQSWLEDDGGISFSLDAAVAAGRLVVCGENDEGGRLYKMTKEGEKDAAALIKKLSTD